MIKSKNYLLSAVLPLNFLSNYWNYCTSTKNEPKKEEPKIANTQNGYNNQQTNIQNFRNNINIIQPVEVKKIPVSKPKKKEERIVKEMLKKPKSKIEVSGSTFENSYQVFDIGNDVDLKVNNSIFKNNVKVLSTDKGNSKTFGSDSSKLITNNR